MAEMGGVLLHTLIISGRSAISYGIELQHGAFIMSD